jgi:hypothetical protein
MFSLETSLAENYGLFVQIFFGLFFYSLLNLALGSAKQATFCIMQFYY